MENIPVFYDGVKSYDTTRPPRRQPLPFTWILGLGSRLMMLGQPYRLEKIRKLTGLDLRQFDHAIVFRVALMVRQYLASRENR